jgi:simple sugar transport system ATP-binding protein
MNQITAEIDKLTQKYGFDLNASQKIYGMSVSQKQTVEIVKVLYRGAEILILDEPTAVLTPQETKKLFDVLRNMRKAGKSIIIITHKLNEVLELSDRVAVLRKGKYVGTIDTAQATVNSLAEMMVGTKVSLDIDRTDPVKPQKRIEVRGITSINKEGLTVLKEVSFHASSGEILGIAGIAGSGQKELLEAIAGLQPIESGEILYYSPEGSTEKISDMKAADIRDLHISLAFVPEDRLGMGLVGSMDLTDNMMLRSYKSESIFMQTARSRRIWHSKLLTSSTWQPRVWIRL